MYSLLGYLSLALIVILVLPYALRILNKNFLGSNKQVLEIIKKLKKIHKPSGILLATVSIIHGYSALGGFRLHSGSLLYISMLITVCFGVLFHLKKQKIFLNLHKSFVLLTIIFLGIHLLFPSALYCLMN